MFLQLPDSAGTAWCKLWGAPSVGQESAPRSPPSVLELWVGRLPGPWEERQVHTTGPSSRGAWGWRKCKQLPPSHPGPWSLGPKTLLPKIAHPKLWPASFKLPTVSLGMNEGGKRPVRSWPSAPSPACRGRPQRGRPLERLRVLQGAFLTAPFPPAAAGTGSWGWSLRTRVPNPPCKRGYGVRVKVSSAPNTR